MNNRKGSYPNRDYRYGYNGKENDNEVKGESNQQDYGFRVYDPRVGRFLSVDPLASEFPSWTPYHYVHNNPILLTDPTGMKADSTRIYNTNGQHQFTIKDNLPNEDHFLTQNKINDLNSQCCTEVNQEGEYARSVSEFYIGADTRQQIKSITSLSDKIGKEQAFVLTVGKDRQLDVMNISKFVSYSSSQIKGMPEGIINSGIKGVVGSGHAHLTSPGQSSQYFPSFIPGVTTPANLRQMSDYGPVMQNPFNRSVYGNHLAVVSSKVGMTVYITGVPLRFIRNNDLAFTFKGKTIR